MDRTCSYCGAVAEAPEGGAGAGDVPGGSMPTAWSFSVDHGRVKWLCVDCARINIRAIEGKLPEKYWQ
jgi:hypothetical protein